jgi:nitroreductase
MNRDCKTSNTSNTSNTNQSHKSNDGGRGRSQEEASFQELTLEALSWRYAVKKFNPLKKISLEDRHILLESLRLTPSSYGLQPWKFILVENLALRKLLRTHSWNQSQVEEASDYVVLAYKEDIQSCDIQDYLHCVEKQRGVSPESLKGLSSLIEKSVRESMTFETRQHWSQRQSYIALGFLLLTASFLKIDTCPLEGFNPEKYDDLLGLKGTGFKSLVAVALGYRDESDKYQYLQKVRFDQKDMISIIS